MADKLTLARPYAKAVLEIASAHEDYNRWSYVLSVLSFVATDERVTGLLRNQTLSPDELASFFCEVCGANFTAEESNLVRVLAYNRRLNVIAYIATLYEQFKATALKILKVELISAKELDELQKTQISQRLKGYFSRTIELDCHIDSSLIGGYVVKAGNQVIDASLRGKLMNLKNTMGGR